MSNPSIEPKPHVAGPAAPAHIHRGWRAFRILGSVAGSVILLWVLYAVHVRGQESTDDAQVEADVTQIGARIGGIVAEVLVPENAEVKAGQVILRIDPAEARARMEQASAEADTARAQASAAAAQEKIAEASARGGFQSAQANLAGSSAGVSQAESQVAAAKAALDRATAEAERSANDWARAKGLFQANAMSKAQLDSAQTGHDAAQAALMQARAQLAAAEDSKRGAESRVTESQGKLGQSSQVEPAIASARAATELAGARVRAAEAALQLATLQHGYTTVTAPADGTLSQFTVQRGTLVSAGQPLAVLVSANRYAVANFKETQVGGMAPGDEAVVTVDAFPGREWKGRIESLSGGTGARFALIPPDNASGNFVKVVQRVPVRIRLTDPTGEVTLRAGMSAGVTVRVGTAARRGAEPAGKP